MEILKTVHKNERYLCVCCLLGAFLCFAQITGNTALIGSAIVFFMVLLCRASFQGMAFSVLMFFLPWSPLIKISMGSTSFFTIGIILVCCLNFLKSKLYINKRTLILALVIVNLTLFAKLINEYSVDLSYIMFIFLLFFFPTVVGQTENEADFHVLTLFFSVGIILAALTAKELVVYPNIARYIDVYSWNIVTRFSGYYGDPNFYSAQISAAIAGVLFLVLSEEKKSRLMLYTVLIVLLLYCGFLSASKAFIITICLIFLIWIAEVLFKKNRIKIKMTIMVTVIAVIVFVIFSGIFSDMIKVIRFRFGQSVDLNSLTTGRIKRWILYVEALINNIWLFLVGSGFTNIKINDVSPHNTVIQMVFQLGISGTVMLFGWFVSCYKSAVSLKNKGILPIGILLIGTFLPWMALDMMFFDELFLLPLFIAVGIERYRWGTVEWINSSRE